ncbi:pseudouridylate synthase TRUB2, mitochondrial [Gouania willdenowi]|uniref:Pseudouridine synthase II N-terminal domain-containing protein n=1 Tax=Gouania willdenowi TaxID=441366 RepID=A0A8C5HJY5_GOUWI|nr:mitochondrial mRNA pseudouridine synthase TRUB2 [Gouania willdenowi]
MASPAVRIFQKLEGLFCVYKPAGVHWKIIRDTVETSLLKGLNDCAPKAVPHHIRFLVDGSTDPEAPKGLTVSAASVPALSQHPLVTGPEFLNLKVGVGHRLDTFSSGVLVLAVGKGNKILSEFYKTRVTRDYTLEGEFGTATDNFSVSGRAVERSTYDHITLDKLEKVLAMLQGANQKALLAYSSVDMRSQEAYEMAVKGLLGPEGKSAPILTGLRCIHFQPPHFTLEVQCINETQKYLCKVVHEIGLELRSTAMCRGVRRTRDGPFTVKDALTHHQWTAADIQQAIQLYKPSKKTKGPPKNQAPSQISEGNVTDTSQRETKLSETALIEQTCS